MNEQPSFRIALVRTANDLASTVKLFRAYAASLDVDLSYQGFEAEMEAMPGEYVPPAGEWPLARDPNGTAVGCVGLRPNELHGCCEMKRLYVSPEVRGFGLGERLVDAVVKEAKRIGYRQMRLDTLPSMTGAILRRACTGRVSSRPIEPKSLSASNAKGGLRFARRGGSVIFAHSFSRSAESKNCCRISGIRPCRASCLIFSAIA